MPCTKKKKVECACCGDVGWHAGHNYIQKCYDRWKRAGYPEDGPPMPGYLINREEYARLRLIWHMPVKDAAKSVGISVRTAWRYEKRMKEWSPV